MINEDDNDRIKISRTHKIILVTVLFVFFIFMAFRGQWYQGLLVINIALHYREFIEFFTDFNDEYYPRKNAKDIVKNNTTPNTTPDTILDTEPIKTNGKSAYSDLYDIDEDYDMTSENFIANNFYEQLYNKYERDINRKESFKTNINLSVVSNKDLLDYDIFSIENHNRSKRFYQRSKTKYPNDDIKLYNVIDLNKNMNWWEFT